jgi:hypothetical protein
VRSSLLFSDRAHRFIRNFICQPLALKPASRWLKGALSQFGRFHYRLISTDLNQRVDILVFKVRQALPDFIPVYNTFSAELRLSLIPGFSSSA